MKIAVLFGGQSSERDVSAASASQVYMALKRRGHEVMAVDTATGPVTPENEADFLSSTIRPLPPDTDSLQMMKGGLMPFIQNGGFDGVDICFLALHGGSGENGMLQGFLDIMGIPYTGTSHLSSACAMDKDITKTLFIRQGVPTPKWCMLPESYEEIKKQLSLPVVIKPNKEGSTVGLTVVKKDEDYEEAVRTALKYDREVMAEEFIAGREFTVGVLAGEALAAGEIIPKLSDIFDYQSKYMPGGSEEIFPAPIDAETADRMKKLALEAAKAAKIESYCRVDFRMDPEGNLFVLEINTLPGMTQASLLPKSAAAAGIEFDELCERICRLGLENRK